MPSKHIVCAVAWCVIFYIVRATNPQYFWGALVPGQEFSTIIQERHFRHISVLEKDGALFTFEDSLGTQADVFKDAPVLRSIMFYHFAIPVNCFFSLRPYI